MADRMTLAGARASSSVGRQGLNGRTPAYAGTSIHRKLEPASKVGQGVGHERRPYPPRSLVSLE